MKLRDIIREIKVLGKKLILTLDPNNGEIAYTDEYGLKGIHFMCPLGDTDPEYTVMLENGENSNTSEETELVKSTLHMLKIPYDSYIEDDGNEVYTTITINKIYIELV